MIIKLAKGLLFLAYIPLYLLVLIMLLFTPVMSFSDLLAVAKYEVPKDNPYFILLFIISFILYLSVRIQLFRKLYQKIPVLWPLTQMLFIVTIGLAVGLFFMNMWAENEVISRGMAIILSVISFLLARAFMAYWYWKYPISVKMFK